MSTTVLPQLREIESELAAQEESLSARLQEVQDKLSGIRAVLPMFGEDSESETAEPAAKSTAKSTAKSAAKSTQKSTQKSAASSAKATKEKTPTATDATADDATADDATADDATQTKAKSKKKDGRAADWQKYTRPGVKNQSIPDAVKLILATQPEKEFKIAEVMEALFKEGMPKAQYLKARNRVSNVLSGGVRAGDWHRGDRSTYRMGDA
ncbi:MAG: hypothetical protein DCF25_12725 [Leptolyngbya foveolarum]|uniref:Uncharacterized protein n=1 Tax=Leptolyngbya foveolarum TaxID=47253 RepID=A0A2W4U5X4_9CYAN|nr:MAG: hypothetical protein DCF25_12725 [Leptolyngbya foveolarum]